jgi:hypothetical protein
MNDYREWHKQWCAEYRADFHIYEIYARTLEQILKLICRSYAPLAIVKARAKTFSSFAEKIARKAEKYKAFGIGPTAAEAIRSLLTQRIDALRPVNYLNRRIKHLVQADSVKVMVRGSGDILAKQGLTVNHLTIALHDFIAAGRVAQGNRIEIDPREGPVNIGKHVFKRHRGFPVCGLQLAVRE